MRIQATRQQSSIHTAVTAYLDGSAFKIEGPVMGGKDQFEKAESDPGLDVSVVGRRIRPSTQKNRALLGFAAAGVAVAGGVAAGLIGDPALGALVAGTSLPALLYGGLQWKAANASPSFQPAESKTESQAKKVLSDALVRQREDHPRARQVAYLSGHGNHKEVAGFSHETLGEVLRGSPVDMTVLDACLCSQLEVVAELAPYAGLIFSSADIVPNDGLPIDAMFGSRKTAEEMFEPCVDATVSMSLLDSKAIKEKLLPALDSLGRELMTKMQSGERRQVVEAVTKSDSPEPLSERVDLASFLDQLEAGELNSTTVKSANEAFEQSVIRNHDTPLTFRLDAGENKALPKGWRDFLGALGKNHKIGKFAVV